LKLLILVALVGCIAIALAVSVLWAAGRGALRAQTQPAMGPTANSAKDGRPVYSKSGYGITPLRRGRIDELAKGLSPDERHILLDKGTERPFCGLLLDNKEKGTYVCRLCGLPLFSSDAKFKSGTGWPSFFQPFDRAHIRNLRDISHGMVRTEIECARCTAHLGHVFDDGPPPTGLRYCLNSASLKFYPSSADLPPESRPIAAETAYFAGGCFWGVEDRFQQVPGVIDAVSGYQGGTTTNPTYKLVCTGRTGHAEAVRVTFDPKRVTYRQLLEWFFRFHDPTTPNRQGPDVGEQYRSAIFAANDVQLKDAKAFVEEQSKADRFRGRKIVTQVQPAGPFYMAEEYHQNYHAKHGGSCPLPAY
jgi:peptide methionine sulfoxide reductase msrA/msrB